MHKASAFLISVSLLGPGCSEDGESDPIDPGGGDPMGMGGGPATGGCTSTGTGTVDVRITGLPAGVPAAVTLTGPAGSRVVEATTLLSAQGAGTYSLAAARVAAADPIVRSVYEATLAATEFCLPSGGTQRVELSYSAIPSSHHLWTNNSNGDGNLLGFAGDILDASASAAPGVSVSAGAGKDVTFDADGNLWSMGSTVADPHLMRFSRSALGSSGDKTADRGIDLTGVPCLPAMRAFAFDPSGSLWVSSCGGRISKLGVSQLTGSGEVSPSVNLSGLTENGDVAFDAAGNLWVTEGPTVVRFDASRLGSSSDAAPDLALRVRSSGDAGDLVPSNLAFDAAGDLWVIDFGGNLLARVARAELGGSGDHTAVSEVTLALSVSALLERPAFDESGGLWLALSQNQFGRLAPNQLALNSTPGSPTTPAIIITSPSMGNANRMAFFPAAAGLPLFHAFR